MKNCQFKYDVGQKIFFIKNGDVETDKIIYGQIHMSDTEIKVLYKLGKSNSCNVNENTIFEDVESLLFSLRVSAEKKKMLLVKK